MWINDGGRPMKIKNKKKILIVSIINFEKVDKLEGGLDNVDKVILLNVYTFFMFFFYHLIHI